VETIDANLLTKCNQVVARSHYLAMRRSQHVHCRLRFRSLLLKSTAFTCPPKPVRDKVPFVTRSLVTIGVKEQLDAPRSQVPQGAGDETGKAWCTAREMIHFNAVAHVTEDGGEVENIPVVVGRAKTEGASNKAHASPNTPPVRSAQTRGLTNTANTCFLNALLQCLGRVWELDVPKARQPRRMRSLESRLLECISQLQLRLRTQYTPRPLLDTLPQIADEIHPGQPADAHAFLVCLLGKMDQGGRREAFYGSMQTVLTCSTCPHSLAQQAAFAHWSLHIEAPMSSTVNQCLEAFFTPASALDECLCDSCSWVGTSTLSPSISAPPTILMMHLKRLVLGIKIQHLVGFEEELDLSPHMAVKGEPQIYELIRAIEHIRSHKEGHYVAFTRGEEAWNQCDDTNISPVALTTF